MLTIKVDVTGLREVQAMLTGKVKQVRFAAAKALTSTAWKVARAETAEVDKVFDKPTPFIKKSFTVERATPANLTAIVRIKPKQAAILRPHIVGGRRGQTGFERRLAGEAKTDGYWVPGQGVKLNQYGNLSLATIRQIAAGLQKSGKFADVFVGQPRGQANAPFGIWARPKRGKDRGALKPLLVRIAQPGYRKHFDFYGVAQRTVERDFQAEFDKALASALASAR
jgi:hypothetical protein